MITPRGYYREEVATGNTQYGASKGQDIMIRSFRTIEKELRNRDIPLDHKWALLHAIHTTADFEMEKLLHTDEKQWKHYIKVSSGNAYGPSLQT